jgi:hypothetical protein
VPLSLPVSGFDTYKFYSLPRLSQTSTDGYKFHYSSLKFDQASSPGLVRSYLSFATNSGKEFIVEQQFYVSEVWQFEGIPGFPPQELQNKPDRFYINP